MHHIAFPMFNDDTPVFLPSNKGQYFNFDQHDVYNSAANDEHVLYYNWLADLATTSHICNNHKAFITYSPIKNVLLQFYPHFSTFLTYVTSYALSSPHHLPMCTYHVPPNHRTYSFLHCTYMHYPIRPCPHLVPYGYAVASYHISLTHLSVTHSSPLVLYTFPIWHAS